MNSIFKIVFVSICMNVLFESNSDAAGITQFIKICENTTTLECNSNQILTITNVSQVFGFNSDDYDCASGAGNKSIPFDLVKFKTYCNFTTSNRCDLKNVSNLFQNVDFTVVPEDYLNKKPLRYETNYICNGNNEFLFYLYKFLLYS